MTEFHRSNLLSAGHVMQASLQGLNEALGKQEAVPMERFRPNIVVTDTGEPFSEDAWEGFSVQRPGHSPCKFKTVVPCDRCKVPPACPLCQKSCEFVLAKDFVGEQCCKSFSSRK